MNIFFVRHGQTKCNELGLGQNDYEPLSDNGLKQAEMIARRAKALPIDIIHASPMKRASQTAETIKAAVNKEIIYSELLIEHRLPSLMIGKALESSLAAQIRKECNLHQDDINWHYSDEENFLEYKARARQALEYLSALPQKNVLVVSHGNFIKMLVLTMTLGDLIKPAVLYTFANKFRLRNTGLTYCKKTAAGWSVESFNDHRHLG